MNANEIFERLMKMRSEQWLDLDSDGGEQFNVMMWDVARALGLSREQADMLAGDVPSEPMVEVAESVAPVLNPNDAIALAAGRTATPVKLTRCACGHSVPSTQVMNASMGTSCPDCYDRMSN